jgi:hypothetical protein
MTKEKPFWWPDPQSFIAIALVLAMIALVFVLAFRSNLPDSDMFKMVVGGFVTVGFANIVQFYFGSSKGSAAKDDTINKIATDAKPATVPDSVKALVLLAILILGALAFPGDAMAEGRKSTVTGPISGNAVPCDPANLLPGCKQTSPAGQPGNLLSFLSKPLQDLQAFITGDFTGAAELAVKIPNLQDGNGQACWTMLSQAGAVLKEHPVPITFQGATDLEALRLLLMTANKVCQNAACTQVFTEAGNIITSVAPLSVPLPNLTFLCSKVPSVAVVAPTIAPAPANVPAQSSAPAPVPDQGAKP